MTGCGIARHAAIAAAATTGWVTTASAAEAPGTSHSHTHAHAEVDQEHGPLLVEATYVAETIGNARGGLERGVRYLDNLDLVVQADLEALAGWRGANAHVYALYNNGESISELVGDAQAVSNIETGTRALRLYEAWISQRIGDSASIKVGLYDLNSEFDALEAAGLFVGSAHGIGTEIAQSGLNGPSIFPSTSLALRIEGEVAPGWVARLAVLDGVPGDPAEPDETQISLSGEDGALAIVEQDIRLSGLRVLLGHWRYTARFEALDGGSGRGNAGTYVRGETTLWDSGARKLEGFFRLGTASGRYNTFDRFVSAGLKLTGPFGAGGDEELGLALASAFTSEQYREVADAGPSESVAELTYRRRTADWLTLQPSLQYVRSPSADPSIRDAFVVGLRAEISARLFGDRK